MFERLVVTVAVGNGYYYYLAKNLITSFLYHNDPQLIGFQVLTDNEQEFQEFHQTAGITVTLLEGLSDDDRSFTSKFRLADFILGKYNLFVDCDCLIYKPLDGVFDKFKNCAFGVVGEKRTEGDFFGNIPHLMNKFDLDFLPHFVGSVYYYTDSEVAKSIFAKARALKPDYDEIGLIRLRQKENEEPLLALAMALYGQEPISEDGLIKADCMFFEKCWTNVLSGKTKLRAKKLSSQISISFNPAIIHFNDSYSEKSTYLSDVFRLKNSHRSKYLLELWAWLRFEIPEVVTERLKSLLRPLYHRMFSPSKIKVIRRSV